MGKIEGIRYEAPEHVKGTPFSWKFRFEDGEEKKVPKDITPQDAHELATKFSDRFVLITTDGEKSLAPLKNKAMTATANKGATGAEAGDEVILDPLGRPVTIELTSHEKGALTKAKKKILEGAGPDDLTELEKDILQRIEDSQPVLDGLPPEEGEQ